MRFNILNSIIDRNKELRTQLHELEQENESLQKEINDCCNDFYVCKLSQIKEKYNEQPKKICEEIKKRLCIERIEATIIEQEYSTLAVRWINIVPCIDEIQAKYEKGLKE